MPHFFIKTNVDSPNPGRWTHGRAQEICARHHGRLENVWYDDANAPQTAYVLVENGDLDGLSTDFHATEVTTLHDAP